MNNKKILSKGWKLLALNEICDLQNGYAFKSNDYINISNTLNCRMSNIRPDGFFDIEHNQKFLPDSYIEKYKQYLLKDGDVIIAMTDMATEAKILGVPTIVKTQGKNLLLNQRVGKLIIKKPELINFPYLKYVLNREQVKKYFLKFAGGGLQINLGKEDILSVEIPLPPIAEQKRIAEILDRTQSLISKRKEAIAKLDTLTQSIFLEMFGDPDLNPKEWEVTEFSSQIKSVRYGTGSPPIYSEEGIPFIRATNVKEGTVKSKDMKRISLEEANKIAKCQIKFGDLIVVRSGVNTGDCAMISREYDGAYAAFDLIVELPLTNAIFYNFLINSAYGKSYLAPLTRRAAQPHLNAEQLKNLRFISPSMSLKEEFAKRVEAVEKIKETHRASLSELQALFASLQHRAFRGEL